MKRAGFSRGACKAFVLSISLFTASVSAITVGKFSYKGALEDYNNDTIRVNDTMIAMSEKIFSSTRVFADTLVDTPSIMFVIDNSTSMISGYNTDATDRNGNRFTAWM